MCIRDRLLCEESPTYIPVQHEAVERERPLFRLPNPAPNNDRVTRYLLGRGISPPTIRYCIERKILYESAEYHNCVFLGKDPQGVPKYAALRGIYDYGKPFKREAPGSQKQYGFCIPPMQRGTTVAVFEAAIDAMAEMTLCGDAADKYRLSLGGVSSSGKEPLALQEFLRQHPEITTIEPVSYTHLDVYKRQALRSIHRFLHLTLTVIFSCGRLANLKNYSGTSTE